MHSQPANSYRYARNLRLLYNTDPSGAPLEGRSLSLEIMAGTQKAYSVPVGYTPIGEIDTPLGLAVFSHNGTYSEIGLVDADSEGIAIQSAEALRPDGYQLVYYTLYNDQFDPNEQKLGLPLSDHFQPVTLTENSLITRIYWADGTHGLRVLNLKLAWDESGTSYHHQITAGITTIYPRHLSVHQMAVLPDVAFTDLDYFGRIPGKLLSGGYQPTYRYRTRDGHASPWAPLSPRPYIVSDKPVPANTIYTNAPQWSHHARYMGASGVATTDGMRLYLRGVDMRWDTIEVALLYHRGNVGVERALLTHRISLNPARIDPELLEINLTDFSGTALNTADFLSQQQGFDSVQTIASLNNRLYAAGLKLAKNLAVDASQITTAFCEQLFIADETIAPTFKEKINPENPARKDGDKLTNSVPVTSYRTTTLFVDKQGNKVDRTYAITQDYDHNKGVQVSANLTGYRRMETYPFAALCIDTKGIPYFAVPLTDVTFPNWSDSPPAKKGDVYYETIHLGVVFNGIRLPSEMVFDKTGQRRLGSVLILRGNPSGRIGFQAVALNCTTSIFFPGTKDISDQGYSFVKPHASWNNAFVLANSGFGGGPSHQGPHATHQPSEFNNDGAVIVIGDATNTPNETINKAYWVTLSAPDILTTGVLPSLDDNPTARLQLLGTAHGSAGNEIRLTIAEGVDFPGSKGGPLHVYTKNYKTNGELLAGGEQNGRPKLNAKSRIKNWFIHTKGDRNAVYSDTDTDHEKLKVSAYQQLFPQFREGAFSGTNQPEYRIRYGSAGNPKPGQSQWEWNYVDAMAAPGTIVAKLKDWEALDVIESADSYVSVALVNFVKAADEQPPADERTYVPTGYQLNITDAMLAQMPTDVDAAGHVVAYIINGAEVYGGDTYVNLVDMCRMVPIWDDGCERRNSYTPDYGVGLIVPIESKYNYALRQGRSLANNAMYSQEAACENRFLHATNGIAWGQPEEWNINAVLTPKETIALYKPLPASVTITDDRPYSVQVSQVKTYGERDDSFRQWRPLDYYDLDGTKGKAMRAESLLNGIYLWQERDYGRLRARDRAIIPTSIGEIVTGTGKDLDGIDYAGQGIGLHQFSGLTSASGKAYWLDTERKLLCRLSQAGKDELSEKERQHDLFFTTIPDRDVSQVQLGIDERQGDVYLSYGRLLTNQTRTLLYNEKGDFFTSETDCQPVRYIPWRGKLYGVSRAVPSRVLRLSSGPVGEYDDQSYLASLEWIINPVPLQVKTFDNLGLTVTAPQALMSLEMRTPTDVQYVNLTPSLDRRVQLRQGRLWFPLMNLVPRNGDTDPRLRADHLRLMLTIDPSRLTSLDRFTLTATETLYRLSPRV